MARRRLNKRKFLFRIISIFLVLYIGIQMYHKLSSPYEIYKLDYGEVNIESTYPSFIMRNETMVSTQNSGQINYFVADSERVKRGQKVAEIIVEDQEPVVNSQSENMPVDPEELLTITTETLDVEIEALSNQIVELIQTQNLFKIPSLKEELALKLDKRDRVTKSVELKGLASIPFTEEMIGSINAEKGQVINTMSPNSGIITFTTDGYEDILNISKLYDLDYAQLASQPIVVNDLKTDRIGAGAPIFKLVDSSVWYTVSLIDQEEIKPYHELINKSVNVDFNQEKIIGKVFDVFETGNNSGALVIQYRNYATGFYNERKKELKITRENYRGLKVPKDAIIDRDGYEGVYVIGLENEVQFVRIKAIVQNDQEVIVYENLFYEKSGEEVIKVNTVNIYSQIVRNPSKIKNGDLVY